MGLAGANDAIIELSMLVVFILTLVIFIDAIFSRRFFAGLSFIIQSNKIFRRYPVFLVPILSTWIIYAGIILYLTYFINAKVQLSSGQVWLIIFLTIFVFAFIISFSALIVLVMIKQIESNRKRSLGSAFLEVISFHIIRSLPIIFVWSVIWFLLVFIEQGTSGSKKNEKEGNEFNLENAAKTLSGYDQDFSISGEFFRLVNKGVRMTVFLILPGIVWEELSAGQAFKKGYTIIKSNIIEFISVFIFSDLAAMVIFFPLAFVFILSSYEGVTFPAYIWVGVIIYGAIAWSYYLYLEQMSSALFYLWYLRWEKKMKEAVKAYQPIPKLIEIEKPSLLDEIFEFENEKII